MSTNFDPDIELQPSTFNFFDFNEFRKFVVKNGIVAAAISYVIGSQINNLIDSLLKHLIIPLMQPDFDNDGKHDLDDLEKYKLRIGPFNFGLGKVTYDFIKFIIVLYFTFVVSRFTVDLVN